MSGARRWSTSIAMAMVLVAAALPAAALADDGASGTGHRDAGESASAWNVGGFLFWMVIVIAGVGVLVLALVLTAGGRTRSSAPAADAEATDATDADRRPLPRPVEHVHPAAGWELAVLAFAHVTGAERAFADVRRAVGDPAWLHDVAFVEARHRGRTLLRGTFAGHYIDDDDVRRIPSDAPILEAIRAGVPEGGSGLIAFAPPAQVETLVAAFDGRTADVHRHRVSAAEAASLAGAVAASPLATAPDHDAT
jgi:hypothetical protein